MLLQLVIFSSFSPRPHLEFFTIIFSLSLHEDWPLQSATTWAPILSVAFGEHLCGAPDVQPYCRPVALASAKHSIIAISFSH